MRLNEERSGSGPSEEPEVGSLAWGRDLVTLEVRRYCCCSSMLVLTATTAFGLLLVAVAASHTWRRML